MLPICLSSLALDFVAMSSHDAFASSSTSAPRLSLESGACLWNGGGHSWRDGRRPRCSSASHLRKTTPFNLRLPVLTCVRDSDKDGWEMSTEDIDSWDATLQGRLVRVLDDVVTPRACSTTLRVPSRARTSQPVRQRRA